MTYQKALEKDSVKQKRYDIAHGAFAGDVVFGFRHVIDGYDWASLGKATIVDVGGGMGSASKSLASAFPELSFVVEDQPDVIANAAVEPDLKGRVKFIEHDFFTEQPVKNADIYFIRRVFMEQTREQGVLILKSLLPAMKSGARVLIQDAAVPDPGTCPLWIERRLRNSDMLALAMGRDGQKEPEEWEMMFEKAGEGFEYKGITVVPNSDVIFIEAVARGIGGE
jgi:hypothetical protein